MNPAPRPWQPLCEGERGATCLAVAHATAQHVCDAVSAGPADLSLMTGLAGAALVAHEVGSAVGDAALVARGLALLDQAMDRCADAEPHASLHYGFPGVAWVAARLHDVAAPDLDDIDDALVELLAAPTWCRDYDLLGGLVGLGVYGLERGARPAGRAIVAHAARHLAALADESEAGCSWLTRPEWLGARTRALYPRGYRSLGAAHGVPCAMAFLALAAAAGIEAERAARLARGAARWLFAQARGHDPTYSSLPSFVAEGHDWHPARSAWCYGEPGVAAALLLAARALGDAGLAQAATALGLRAAGRRGATARVVDAGLCHGSAGLALLFARLHHESGRPELADAALHWIDATLAYHRPGQGIGGFLALVGDEAHPTWEADHSLLAGAGGIALALVAVATRRTPDWASLLLVSAPAGVATIPVAP